MGRRYEAGHRVVSDTPDSTPTPELDGLLRRALAPPGAPPGLRERIQAALAVEAAQHAAAAVRRRRLYRPALGLALAASLLIAILLPPALRPGGFLRPAVTAGPRHIHYQGVVVCVDCAALGEPLEVQASCRSETHGSGLRLEDGALVRFTRRTAARPEPLVDPSLRGRQIVLDGDLYETIGYLEVTSYSLI